MIEWQKRYGKEGLVIIAITPGYQPKAWDMLKNMAKGMGINYRLAQWEKEQSKLPKPISLAPSYPAALLIDRQGKLRGGVFGPWLLQLEKELKAALKEKPPTSKPENKPANQKTQSK